MREDDLSQMFECAASLLSSMPPSTRLFLAADTEAVRGYAKQMLGARVVFHECSVAHTGEHHAIRGHHAVTVSAPAYNPFRAFQERKARCRKCACLGYRGAFKRHSSHLLTRLRRMPRKFFWGASLCIVPFRDSFSNFGVIDAG